MSSRLTVNIQKAAVALSLTLGVFVPTALAQEIKYRDGRFLETIGGVTIQRADEASSDEAILNMPFLPGDRVWTDQAGRAEIVFAEGEILWIAERSKVDSLGRGGPDQDERLGLRVFAGSFGARVRSRGPGFEFRAPGGSITTTGAAAFRVDVRAGETVVSVSEGEVLVDLSGQRLTVRSGERVRYSDGDVEGPFGFQRAAVDSFDRWCEERSTELERMARDRDHERLPDELDPYGDELDRNGEWVYDEPQGYVYVPRVAYDWAPYTYGRWVYTLYGWTWVADEPWGFVTSHYGRWGYSSRVGWHWLPKAGFSGAWVGWSTPVGRWNNTIGWCALGFNDRPVGSFAYGSGGRAVPRGSRSLTPGHGWSFTNRADMGRANVHRRRVDVPVDEAQRAAVWNPGVTPDRNFRETRRAGEGRGGSRAEGVVEAAGAVARGSDRSGRGSDAEPRINIRPSPGDSTPELRSDPMTTIPTPESRRRRGMGQDGFKEEQDNRRNRNRFDETSHSVDQTTPASASPAPAPAREPSTRDPLLSRFFRSITRSDAATDSAAPRGDDSSARRRNDYPRDDSSARDNGGSRERSRPRETTAPPRSIDDGRQRSRPAGGSGERSQPRTSPPPRPEGGGSSDDRGAARRPRPGH
jgi:hypothetical protein